MDLFLFFFLIHISYICFQLSYYLVTRTTPHVSLSEPGTHTIELLIPAADEEAEVLRHTIASCLDLRYECRIVIIENSRDTGHKDVAIRVCQQSNVDYVSMPNFGNKAKALNRYIFDHSDLGVEYYVILDADQCPDDDFVDKAVNSITSRQNTALVQFPQTFRNRKKNFVTRLYASMQYVYFDIILPAKNALTIGICNGTNFIVSREALIAVGGFDEKCKIEDVATSFSLATSGRNLVYVNENVCSGLAPETIQDVLRQFKRYAIGHHQMLYMTLSKLCKSRSREDILTTLNFLHFSATPLVSGIMMLILLGANSVFIPKSSLIFYAWGMIVLLAALLISAGDVKRVLVGQIFFSLLVPISAILSLDPLSYNLNP